MIEKKLRLQQLERDLQSLIERAIAYEWQTYVESMKTVPASGRPKRVKLKFVLTCSDGWIVVISLTSDCSSLSKVKRGLVKYEVPIRSLANFILNFDDCYIDEETLISIESDGHVLTHDPKARNRAKDESELVAMNDNNVPNIEEVGESAMNDKNVPNIEEVGESGDEDENEDNHDAEDSDDVDDNDDVDDDDENDDDDNEVNNGESDVFERKFKVWKAEVQYQAIHLLGDDQLIVRDNLGPSSRWSELMLWSEMYSEIRILKVDGVCYGRSEQEDGYRRITVSPECVWANAIRWLFPPTEHDQHPRFFVRPNMQNISWMVITPQAQSAVATTRQLEMYNIISDFMTNG